jgi:uncharacterized protein YndB with AHSA1/START domain
MSENTSQGLNVYVKRVFDAPVAQVWNAWVEPEQVMQWWGPQGFSCPSAQMDFREGGTSLVCMRASAEFGGGDNYSLWAYQQIVPHQRIEYIHNLADENGNRMEPTQVGMPADFPADVRNVVTFQDLGNGQTEMTITEYGLPTQQWHDLSKQGLEECLDKMAATFSA